MSRQLIIGAAAASVLVLAGCAPDPSDDPSASRSSVEVTALDNSFRLENIEIAAGTEVTWENKGRNAHDVLPKDDPAADTWGVLEDRFQPGDSYSFAFTTPGTYAYYCSIHGTAERGMIGSITVVAP